MKKTNEDLEFYEQRERWCLKKLFNDHIRIKMSTKYTYEVHLSQTATKCPYDAFMFVRCATTNEIVKKFFVEVKVRETDYGKDWRLEKKKLNSLKKAAQFEGYDILYVNFTPNRTLIFPVTEIEEENKLGKVTKVKMNKQTFVSRTEKVNKMVYELDEDDAITIKYGYNNIEFNKEYKASKQPIEPPKKKINTYSLF